MKPLQEQQSRTKEIAMGGRIKVDEPEPSPSVELKLSREGGLFIDSAGEIDEAELLGAMIERGAYLSLQPATSPVGELRTVLTVDLMSVNHPVVRFAAEFDASSCDRTMATNIAGSATLLLDRENRTFDLSLWLDIQPAEVTRQVGRDPSRLQLVAAGRTRSLIHTPGARNAGEGAPRVELLAPAIPSSSRPETKSLPLRPIHPAARRRYMAEWFPERTVVFLLCLLALAANSIDRSKLAHSNRLEGHLAENSQVSAAIDGLPPVASIR